MRLKKGYFDSLPISKRKYDGLQSLINIKILPRCHFIADSNLIKNDFRPSFSYILNKSFSVFVGQLKVYMILIKFFS